MKQNEVTRIGVWAPRACAAPSSSFVDVARCTLSVDGLCILVPSAHSCSFVGSRECDHLRMPWLVDRACVDLARGADTRIELRCDLKDRTSFNSASIKTVCHYYALVDLDRNVFMTHIPKVGSTSLRAEFLRSSTSGVSLRNPAPAIRQA